MISVHKNDKLNDFSIPVLPCDVLTIKYLFNTYRVIIYFKKKYVYIL